MHSKHSVLLLYLVFQDFEWLCWCENYKEESLLSEKIIERIKLIINAFHCKRSPIKLHREAKAYGCLLFIPSPIMFSAKNLSVILKSINSRLKIYLGKSSWIGTLAIRLKDRIKVPGIISLLKYIIRY